MRCVVITCLLDIWWGGLRNVVKGGGREGEREKWGGRGGAEKERKRVGDKERERGRDEECEGEIGRDRKGRRGEGGGEERLDLLLLICSVEEELW